MFYLIFNYEVEYFNENKMVACVLSMFENLTMAEMFIGVRTRRIMFV